MFRAQEIETAFFQAMKNGYAAGSESGTVAEFPGSKIISIKLGIFTVTDFWNTTPHSNKSFGVTIISDATKATVWMMHYKGQYEEEAIPLLKKALAAEYNRDVPVSRHQVGFTGCRGPRFFQEGNLAYINIPKFGSDFSRFEGCETIVDRWNRELGRHEYSGFLLT